MLRSHSHKMMIFAVVSCTAKKDKAEYLKVKENKCYSFCWKDVLCERYGWYKIRAQIGTFKNWKITVTRNILWKSLFEGYTSINPPHQLWKIYFFLFRRNSILLGQTYIVIYTNMYVCVYVCMCRQTFSGGGQNQICMSLANGMSKRETLTPPLLFC